MILVLLFGGFKMSDLETLKMGVNIQNVVVSLLEMFEKRVDALEESRDKKEFVINRRICEELMPAIWVTIDRSGYNFPSEFNEAIRKVEDRFDDISDKLTERFSKGEETEMEFDWKERENEYWNILRTYARPIRSSEGGMQ